jgi:type I restriction-modification system DNA methylase subunit
LSCFLIVLDRFSDAMITADSESPRFDTRTGQLIRRCLRVCRYHDDLIEENYTLGSDRNVPFVAFAHRPHDARSACVAFLPESRTPHAEIAGLRELGVPFAFFVGVDSWEMWSLRSDGPQHKRSVPANQVDKFFDDNKLDFAPGSVFRAKTWARAEGARQLDFVDTGLLPIVESEAGDRLRQLFEDMVTSTMDALDMKPTDLTEADAHWLMKANFWLLAGKLLRDKQVPKFVRLDLHDVQDVFDRVAEHYDAKRVSADGRLTALREAAAVAADFSSLRSISTETLGALYEEALLSERTRKLWSVHRTPTYLVDFMLAKLSRWMDEDIGFQNCRVYEPGCGHAPFLVGAVRLLSDLLPDKIASDRTARRQFLRSHIGGCDRDAFSLEIARLSLTLADIPNPNGWKLDPVEDMFAGDYLAEKIATNSVIISNPPFENVAISNKERAAGDLRFARSGQAGELLRRIVNHASANTLFGIVVPQTLLDGASFRELRRNLLSKVEIQEVVTFPDNVFKFAKPETVILIGKKLGDNQAGVGKFKFRRIQKVDMNAFRNENHVPSGAWFLQSVALAHPQYRLLLPPLAEVWAAADRLPRLDEVVHVTIGFYFFAETDRDYPKGEIQVSSKELPDFHQEFRLAEGTPDTHLLPILEWLNQKQEIIRRECGGTKRDEPRVVMNHVRTGGGAWRHKAFIDPIGRPATDAFLLLSPQKENWSLEVLWAIVNGPFASAFTFTNSATKQIGVRLLQRMQVPALGAAPSNLISAVQVYITTAREYTAKYGNGDVASKKPEKSKKAQVVSEGPELPLEGLKTERHGAASVARERLRALHWRVDAEVLKLYALPAELERELLDFFDGVPRVGVPFAQKCYIPSAFREVMRLDEFLRITDEWEQTDERRCQLIEKRIKHGRRSAAEETEFKELQRLFDLRRSYLRWRETGDARSSLFDETELRKLREKDARWPKS